jgi:hypothetical protein
MIAESPVRQEPKMNTSVWRRCARPLAATLIGVALGAPAAACSLDDLTGPGHGGFGAWGALMAKRHVAYSPAPASIQDNGYRENARDTGTDASDAEEAPAEVSEPAFTTLPGPAADVRESGGSIEIDETRDEDPIDLRDMR